MSPGFKNLSSFIKWINRQEVHFSYRNGIRFGMEQWQVERAEGRPPDQMPEDKKILQKGSIGYKTEERGLPAVIYYRFNENGRLIEITNHFSLASSFFPAEDSELRNNYYKDYLKIHTQIVSEYQEVSGYFAGKGNMGDTVRVYDWERELLAFKQYINTMPPLYFLFRLMVIWKYTHVEVFHTIDNYSNKMIMHTIICKAGEEVKNI